MGRTASGVHIMRLGANDRVASFSRTPHDETEETAEVEKASDEEVQQSLAEDANEVIEPEEIVPDDDEEAAAEENNSSEE